MTLDREEVRHIAYLARLGLTEGELEHLGEQLNDILAHFEVLSQIDTEAISPTASVVAIQNVMRPDEVRPSYQREVILSNAPRTEDGSFRVPPVLEE